MAEKKQRVVTIKHKESTHREDMPEDEFNALQDRIKEMYDIKGTKDVPALPAELAEKAKL